MAWIEYVDESTAPSKVVETLDRYRTADGTVDNILRIHGPNPRSLDAHVSLYRTLMFRPSPLTRRQREMLAVVVSAANDCHY